MLSRSLGLTSDNGGVVRSQGKWSNAGVTTGSIHQGMARGKSPRHYSSTTNHHAPLFLKSLILTKHLGDPFFIIMVLLFLLKENSKKNNQIRILWSLNRMRN